MVVLLTACSQPVEPTASADPAPDASPRISILTERDLVHDADEVAAFAVGKLQRNARVFGHERPIQIISIAAVDPQHVRSVESEAPRLEAAVIEPVWVVRALGTFGTFRGPEPGPRLAGSGFFVFSDADGSIVASGFP